MRWPRSGAKLLGVDPSTRVLARKWRTCVCHVGEWRQAWVGAEAVVAASKVGAEAVVAHSSSSPSAQPWRVGAWVVKVGRKTAESGCE